MVTDTAVTNGPLLSFSTRGWTSLVDSGRGCQIDSFCRPLYQIGSKPAELLHPDMNFQVPCEREFGRVERWRFDGGMRVV